MHIENMKQSIESLATMLNAEVSKGADACLEEMSEVADIIKDLSESKYYCTITKEMEEAKEEEETLVKAGVIEPASARYYNDNRYMNGHYAPDGNTMRRGYGYGGRRGYSMRYPEFYDPANEFYMNKDRLDRPRMYYDGGSMNGNGNMNSGNGNMRGYGDYSKPVESNYDRTRRFYTEGKDTHSSNSQEDNNTNVSNLREHLRSISEDVVSLMGRMNPTEKATVKSELQSLVGKIV